MLSNKYFLLGILTLIGVLNFLDRQIMSILLEPIKQDLGFSDSQLGLLTGIYFALVYSLIGIPVARLADRWHRGKIISVSLFFWSAMTVVSGWAGSFVHMALARVGVGIGEAGVAPAAHSLISERFDSKSRASALAFYSLGGTTGIILALFGGGWMSQNFGWRATFFAAGVPGLIFAIFAFILIRETRTIEPLSTKLFKAKEGQRSIFGALAFLLRNKSWRFAAIATSLTHIGTYGIGNWMPSYIVRSYGLSQYETGLLLAGVIGVCGSIGAMSGGIVAERVAARRGVGWLAWTLGVAFLLASILGAFAFTATNLVTFVALVSPFFLLILTSSGVQFAIAQVTVTPDMRAMSSALLILMINLIGLGLGPPIVGALSDWFSASFGAGNQSLRYAMICVMPLLVAGAFYFWKAGHALGSDAIDDSVAGDSAR